MSFPSLVARENNDMCTKDTCPASDSIYGYAPNMAASVFFVVIFALSAIAFSVQTFLYRRWLGFSIALALGTALEAVGYVARILLHNDPFSDLGFKMSVVLLTFSPAFITASIYLILKQICLAFSSELSRLRPKFYTYIFITCDVISMLLQSAGGAISAIATTKSLLSIGVNIMIAGLAFQVFTLLIFGLLAGEYLWRVRTRPDMVRSDASRLAQVPRFRYFLIAVSLSFLCILVRCTYRVAELSGGWGNPIMRNEGEFIFFDSIMVIIAALLLNIFHPGVCFKESEYTSSHIPLADKGYNLGDDTQELAPGRRI